MSNNHYVAPYLQILEEADKKFFKKTDQDQKPAGTEKPTQSKQPKEQEGAPKFKQPSSTGTKGGSAKTFEDACQGTENGGGAEEAVKKNKLDVVEAPEGLSPAKGSRETPTAGKKKVVSEGDKNSMINSNRPKSTFEDLYNATLNEGFGDEDPSLGGSEGDTMEFGAEGEDDGLGDGLDDDGLGDDEGAGDVGSRLRDLIDQLEGIYAEISGESEEGDGLDDDSGEFGEEDVEGDTEFAPDDANPVRESSQYDGKLKPAPKGLPTGKAAKGKMVVRGAVKTQNGKAKSTGLGKKYDGKLGKAPVAKSGRRPMIPVTVPSKG